MKTEKTIIAILLLAIIFLFSACQNTPDPDNNSTITDYALDKEGTLSEYECSARNLQDKILVIHAEHCGACKVAVPILQKLEEELDMTFEYYDLDVNSDRQAMGKYNIIPHYTPTVLFGCEVTIGAKSESAYRAEIEDFLSKQTI